MKRTTFIIASALAMLAMASCTKDGDCTSCPDADNNQEQQTEEKGILKISMAFPEDEAETRALTAYTTVQPYEKSVNRIQVLIFDAAGRLNAYRDLGTSSTASISTTTGTKKVWAVINGPDLSGIASESALKGKEISLSSNSTSASAGFVMAGSTTCSLTTAGATTAVTVSRLTGRIALTSVTNSLPSVYPTLTVKKVYAINVVGSQNLAGTGAAAPSLNLGSDKGAVPALLSKTVGKAVSRGASYTPTTPDLFYGYSNATSTKTRLVVEADIAGQTYYYPVTISSLERNKAYTVSINILNLGSDDPDKPVEKGTISVSISVAGWQSGASYEESI